MVGSIIVFSVKKSPQGGYDARAVGYPIFTQASTMKALRRNAKEAVRAHFGPSEKLPTISFVKASRSRIFGSAKGEFTVPDDFNDPLPKEIEDLFWK
jgi:hypothetical protein